MNIYKLIYNEIKKYKKIYLVRHIGPDPDALGSQLALKESIKLTFPNKEIYALGTSVSRFNYLGKIDKLNTYDYDNALVIALDVPDNKRVDVEDFSKFKNVIKIDHHPKVDTFGKVELINEKASSTCEVVAKLLQNTRLKINESIARKLYIGIISDTNRFLYNTSNETLFLASDLIKKYKLDLEKINRDLYSRPISEIRLMGHIASTLKVDKNGFAYIHLDEEILSSIGTDIAAPANMINDFNNINEILVWAFITYDIKNNQYRVNIRSRGPEINEIAAKYGGGGHKFASGVRTGEKLVLDKLLEELSEVTKLYSKEK
ncbi:MAG: bifunctional oligoribonuclease/PAP phosphatase NrnA [Bacilli bacterium]|nr:bifunctional oligoribonuclease/PAP phosphatase NrnA [Bacilli bacterium]